MGRWSFWYKTDFFKGIEIILPYKTSHRVLLKNTACSGFLIICLKNYSLKNPYS
ncbi:hypothetical protein HPCPY1962_0025 [Helicobacter pylori CPY1962]|nr:hypothetical protein HPCPY1962_0025 [Helicobacter pylori CPY1962]